MLPLLLLAWLEGCVAFKYTLVGSKQEIFFEPLCGHVRIGQTRNVRAKELFYSSGSAAASLSACRRSTVYTCSRTTSSLTCPSLNTF